MKSDRESSKKLSQSVSIIQELVEHLETTTEREIETERRRAKAEYSREIEHLENENDTLQKQVKLLSEDRIRIQKRMSQAYEKKIKILESRAKDVPALKKAHALRQQRIQAIETQAKRQINELSKEVATTSQQNTALATRAHLAESKAKELTKALETTREELSLSRQLYEKKTQDSMAFLRERSLMKEETAELKRALYDREKAKSESRLEFDSALAELGRVQAELENTRREKEEAHKKLVENVTAKQVSQKRIAELEIQLTKAREQKPVVLKNKDAAEITSLTKELHTKEKMIAKLLKQNLLLERKVEVARKEIQVAYGDPDLGRPQMVPPSERPPARAPSAFDSDGVDIRVNVRREISQ